MNLEHYAKQNNPVTEQVLHDSHLHEKYKIVKHTETENRMAGQERKCTAIASAALINMG